MIGVKDMSKTKLTTVRYEKMRYVCTLRSTEFMKCFTSRCFGSRVKCLSTHHPFTRVFLARYVDRQVLVSLRFHSFLGVHEQRPVQRKLTRRQKGS